MTDAGTEPSNAPARSDQHLAEVWGDVVDLRHLAAAVAVGSVVSLGCYAAAGRVFAVVVSSAEVGRSYAMLVGLLGCVAGGAVSAALFPPKRVMTELACAPATSSAVARRDAMVGVPTEVAEEMRALGLLDDSGHDAL